MRRWLPPRPLHMSPSPHRSRFVPARVPSTPSTGRGRACVPCATDERPGAHERGPAPAGQPGARGRRATGKASRRRARVRGRAPHEHRQHDDDTLNDTPDARPASRSLSFTTSSAPARPSPLTALLLLLPAHPHAQPLPACRRPASGPPATCLGCPADLSGRSRKGGPARSGGPPFLESPGVEPDLGRERGGGLLVS